MEYIYYFWAIANLLLFRFVIFRITTWINPLGIFLYINTMIFVGSTYEASVNGIANFTELLTFIGIAQTAFVLGAGTSNFGSAGKLPALELKYSQAPIKDNISGINSVVIFLAVVNSILITFISVQAQGGLVPLLAISALSSGLDEAGKVYMDSRINISAGNKYFAPGYVSQFKDYILPVTTLILYMKYRLKGGTLLLVVVVILFFCSILALMSVGTRSGLVVYTGASILILSSSLFGKNSISRGVVITSGLSLVIFVSSLTILMGRSGDEGFSFRNVALVAPLKVFDRVALVTAKENIKIYDKFLKKAEPAWGSEWMLGLSTILPGRQVPMSIKLAKLVGYSRGNVPFHTWTSYYYNFSYFGVLISFLWGAIIGAYYRKVLQLEKTITNSICLLYSGVLIAFALDPIGLLLYGSLIIIIYMLTFNVLAFFSKVSQILKYEV